MTTDALSSLDLARLGLRWNGRGLATLTGPLLQLAEDVGALVNRLAASWDAKELRYPSLISADDLRPMGYLASFPQLATLATTIPADVRASFAETARRDDTKALEYTVMATPDHLLVPAACYPVYAHHAGACLTAPYVVATGNNCFRNEEYYVPLRRQWGFRMQEIVHLGSRLETKTFLDRARDLLDSLFAQLGLPVQWQAATDPFFNPRSSPGYLRQRLQPTKFEACLGNLAIASINLHEDHFGAAYRITRDRTTAVTGCVAFGIERWLAAVIEVYGTQPADWPDVAAAEVAA